MIMKPNTLMMTMTTLMMMTIRKRDSVNNNNDDDILEKVRIQKGGGRRATCLIAGYSLIKVINHHCTIV